MRKGRGEIAMEWKLCGLKLWSEVLLEVHFPWLHVKKEYLISESPQAVSLEVNSKPGFAFVGHGVAGSWLLEATGCAK